MQNLDFLHAGILVFVAVYFAGVITSLTPCIYPIVPIVIGYLGSRSGSTAQRLVAAALYALGLSLVYSALGIIAALTGNVFGTLTTNPYVYLGFGVLILFLGGSMMDWYSIPMPAFVASQSASEKNGIFGPLLMGVTSGLVASPCTAPVLGSLLLFIASSKAVVKGGLLMFTFSIGMSTLLLALGFFASAATRLPKSGTWMVMIKKILALILIATGIYFIFSAGKLA